MSTFGPSSNNHNTFLGKLDIGQDMQLRVFPFFANCHNIDYDKVDVVHNSFV